MFPLSHIPSTDPHQLLGYKFLLSLVVFGVEANLSPPLQNPIVTVPTSITMVLNKVSSLTSVINNIFLNTPLRALTLVKHPECREEWV